MTPDEKALLEKTIAKLGPDGVAWFRAHGELPEVRLSDEEMRFVKGGRFAALLKSLTARADAVTEPKQGGDG